MTFAFESDGYELSVFGEKLRKVFANVGRGLLVVVGFFGPFAPIEPAYDMIRMVCDGTLPVWFVLVAIAMLAGGVAIAVADVRWAKRLLARPCLWELEANLYCEKDEDGVCEWKSFCIRERTHAVRICEREDGTFRAAVDGQVLRKRFRDFDAAMCGASTVLLMARDKR